MSSVITGQAHGKLLLFGEHAAVYGHAAVGIGLPFPLRVDLALPAGGALGADNSSAGAPRAPDLKLPGMTKEDADRLLAALRLAAEAEPAVTSVSGAIEISSQIPQGAGIGSSAALCAALSRLLLRAATGGEPPERVRRLAHAMEHAYHGTPSGIDTALALFDGLALLRADGARLPTLSPLTGGRFALAAGCLPRSGDTGTLVGALRRRIASGDPTALDAVNQLGAIAEESAALFRTAAEPVAPALARLADRAHRLLAGLGLSSSGLERAIDAGLRRGGLGGKLSGAGGGGAFFVVFNTPDAAVAALPAIAESSVPDSSNPVARFFALEWDGVSVRLLDAG